MKEKGDIIFYDSDLGKTQIEVKLENDSVWLNLNQMGDLFDRDKSVIYRHLYNIFKENELDRDSVVVKNATTGTDGKTYQVEYYNGSKKIADNALVALTLMIAESKPEEKEMMIEVVVNLINLKN